MRSFPAACASLLLAAAVPLHAQEDPLKSPACGAALAGLQAARESHAEVARVEALRREAANTCLGTAAIPSRPSRTVQAPIAVPPPQIEVPPSAPPLPVITPPPPPVAIERMPLPATCDGNGCWVNDGTHMRQVPPSLLGPNGMCTQQAGQVFCR